MTTGIDSIDTLIARLDRVKDHLMAVDGWSAADVSAVKLAQALLAEAAERLAEKHGG